MGRVERGDNYVAELTLLRVASALGTTVATLMKQAELWVGLAAKWTLHKMRAPPIEVFRCFGSVLLARSPSIALIGRYCMRPFAIKQKNY